MPLAILIDLECSQVAVEQREVAVKQPEVTAARPEVSVRDSCPKTVANKRKIIPKCGRKQSFKLQA